MAAPAVAVPTPQPTVPTPVVVTEVPQTDKPIQPKIGIIYPPPEVRNIVDKTASFVARNGPDFESRIRQNEINNPKFNFLNPADPYHAYYQHKVKEFAEGRIPEPLALKVTAPSAARLGQDAPKLIQETFIPKDPPPEFEFIYEPPSINAQDIDMIKVTAQFVARNGRQFLTQLMNREHRNYQFDFLRSQHSMFGYFTKLVEQYTRILIPPKDIVGKFTEELHNPRRLLENVKYRVDWHKYQERQRKREEEAIEKERMAYALIDWHDFVVVESVDFQPNETGNFPLPTTPDEVMSRMIEEERGMQPPPRPTVSSAAPPPPGSLGLMPTDMDENEDAGSDSDDESDLDVEEQVDQSNKTVVPPRLDSRIPAAPPVSPPPLTADGGDDMELSDDEADEDKLGQISQGQPRSTASNKVPPPASDQVIIRQNYDPKSTSARSANRNEDVLLVSPFTGEKIPANQAPKHIRVGLLDPKWVEQRGREIRERKEQEQVYAAGNLIENSLKQLAERRTDIFGVGVDEIQIGKKLGEQEVTKSDKLIWDGYSATSNTITKRTLESVTDKDKQDLLVFQKQLEAARDKIGPSSGAGSAAIPQPPAPPPSFMLRPPSGVGAPAPPPPPMHPPPGLMMMPPSGPPGVPPICLIPPLPPGVPTTLPSNFIPPPPVMSDQGPEPKRPREGDV